VAHIIGNALTTLRLVTMRFDAQGNIETADYPIIAWDITDAPVPLTLVDLNDDAIVGFAVYDRETKHWTTPNGRVHSEFKTVVQPIYAMWDATHPPRSTAVDWPLDAKAPSQRPLPRTTKPPGTEGGAAPGHR